MEDFIIFVLIVIGVVLIMPIVAQTSPKATAGPNRPFRFISLTNCPGWSNAARAVLMNRLNTPNIVRLARAFEVARCSSQGTQ